MLQMLQILLFIRIDVTKLECVGYYQKLVGTRLRNLKKKDWLGGAVLQTPQLIHCRTMKVLLAIVQNVGNLQNIKSIQFSSNQVNFLVSLFLVVSNADSIYHYPNCPIGLDCWCKYNAGRAILLTPKLINLGQIFQKTLFKNKAYIYFQS